MLKAIALHKDFRVPSPRGKAAVLHAVNDVSLTLEAGQTYALVGESGSGKSTLAHLIMGLIPPSGGDVLLDSQSLSAMRGNTARRRFTQMQLILQDGKSALDPKFSVYNSIAEPMRNLLHLPRAEEKRQIELLMRQMELPLGLLPHRAYELSGGQQKRVCIARAIAVKPRLIVFDEAVSGLDVITRRNLLTLLKRLQRENGYTYLFITHDMDAALYIAEHIMVMKDGRIVDSVRFAGNQDCFTHPYSRLLLDTLLPQATETPSILQPSGVI